MNKQYKYIYTLLNPGSSKYYRIPESNNHNTIIVKKSFYIELTPTSNGKCAIQWVPQAFYNTTDGFWIWDVNSLYTQATAASPSTSNMLAPDSTGFIPTGTPVRLVGAQMRVHTSSDGNGNSGTLIGCTYVSNVESNVADTKLAFMSVVSSMPGVKMVKSMNNGIILNYIPFDESCFNFHRANINLGQGANSNNNCKSELLRLHVANSGLNGSSAYSVSVQCFQIFEVMMNNDLLYPRSNYLSSGVSEYIKKYIRDKNFNIYSYNEERSILDEICENICNTRKLKKCKKKDNYAMNFFMADVINKNLRLPSLSGGETHLFKQKNTLQITTSDSGAFCMYVIPDIYIDTLNIAAIPENVYIANSSGYSGFNTPSSATANNTFRFPSYNSSDVFSGIRLVTAVIRIRYISANNIESGNIRASITQDQLLQTPDLTKFTISNIKNHQISKDFDVSNGVKIITIPFDYSNLSFYPPNAFSRTGASNLLSSQIYVIGYGLPKSAKCIDVEITRVFEGLPSTYLRQYLTSELPKLNMSDMSNITNELLCKDMIITKLCEERNLLEQFNK